MRDKEGCPRITPETLKEKYWPEETERLVRPSRRRSRTTYTCDECGHSIPAGTPYLHLDRQHEGRRFKERVCRDCVAVAAVFFVREYPTGCLWQELREHIRHLGGRIPDACLAELSPENRSRVCDEIEQTWRGNDRVDKG